MTTSRAPLTLAVAGLALVGLTSVATLAGCNMKLQQTHGTRNSGQSRLMDDTFAGQNACNPDDHTRPFIIEWDATDMASFESHAASDIVVVKYEGCKLRVLDACKNDSIRGSQGAYKPPAWTSGSLETIDIHNEGELYAKLPLGSASLGGRVSAGEKFHMEYYVAGTVYATRDAVYTGDLASNPGCADATHFVYAYNLGAFALGSANETQAEAGGSVYGFGAGGATSSGRSAEKKGGDLGVCRAHDATEQQGCKTPIRLNLREIYEGESPEAQAMSAPDTAESMSAVAMVNTKIEMSDEAQARWKAAQAKANAGDGNGCLKELEVYDQLMPNSKSTDPKGGGPTMTRTQCLMLSGKCQAGKQLYVKTIENNNPTNMGPELMEHQAEGLGSQFCRGGDMTPRDKVVQAIQMLSTAGTMKKETPEFCTKYWKVLQKHGGKVESKNNFDSNLADIPRMTMSLVPRCYENAGACDEARKAYRETATEQMKEGWKKLPEDRREQMITDQIENALGRCKGK